MDTKHKSMAALKAAFPITAPIFAGYLFLGMTYGILMSTSGFSFLWPLLSSLLVYSGSLQFLQPSLLLAPFNPLEALLLTLMLNARHLFYGLGLLDKYRRADRKKLYMIFGMSDETFSLNYMAQVPSHIDRSWYYFWVTALNHAYWILGSTLGGIFGPIIPFSTEGLDFVMTAMFVIIFLDHWKQHKVHTNMITGLVVSVICLLIFGAQHFVIPAMIGIILCLGLEYKRSNALEAVELPDETEPTGPEEGDLQ